MLSQSFGRSLIVLGLAVIAASPSANAADPASPRYTVTSLDPGEPARINDAGEIAGRVMVITGTIGHQHAALYRNGVWSDLGALAGDSVSIGTDINNLGVVVGMSNRTFDLSNSWYRAVVVENGTVHTVPGLEQPDSTAYGVNDSGQVCGHMGPDVPDYQKPWHAFVASGNTVTDLHNAVEVALGASRFESTALAINGAGDVVGQASQSFTPPAGFVYRGGVVSILAGSDPGTWSLYAPAAINDSGLIAGVAFFGGTSVAALYDTESGTFTPLPVPPGAGLLLRSSAFDLDAAGRVVGEALVQLSPISGRTFAFLYENGQTVDLNALIPPDSGWTLETAMAMNNAGQILGRGVLNGEHGHYFLLTPANKPPTVQLEAPSSVAEGSPATLTALAADPEGSALGYEWDLDGDGTYELTGEGSTVVLAPARDDGPATRTIGVRVTDDAGASATATVTLQILNVAPTATLTASAASVYVHVPVALALTSAFDPSAADAAAGFFYGWDCDGDGVFEAGGATASHDCVYLSGGLQTAIARIRDKDGGFSDYKLAIEVRTLQQGIGGLIDIVKGFGLPKGMEQSFLTKLRHALAAVQAGDLATACTDLEAFINHARAQAGKALSAAQAAQIIGEAEAIRTALGC